MKNSFFADSLSPNLVGFQNSISVISTVAESEYQGIRKEFKETFFADLLRCWSASH